MDPLSRTFAMPTGGEPVSLTVSTHSLVETEDEEKRNAVAMLGEVRLNGTPVFGQRVIVHRSMAYSDAANRRAAEEAVAAFAVALRTALGYDPSDVEGR